MFGLVGINMPWECSKLESFLTDMEYSEFWGLCLRTVV